MTGHESTDLIAHLAADEEGLDRLERLARRMRFLVLEMIHRAGSGHVGSALSCVDLICVLKFSQMNWSVQVPRTGTDVFVLSKGHAVRVAIAGADKDLFALMKTDPPPTLTFHRNRTFSSAIDLPVIPR